MTNATQLSTNTVSTFNFETHAIRTLVINNEPWFVAKDICDALNIQNVSQALANLDDDEKMISSDSMLNIGSAGNGAQSLSLVAESGMYTLILRCRDAVKKGSIPHRFRKWVTAEVLPAIRKTGKYEKPMPIADTLTADEQRQVQNAVKATVERTGLSYGAVWNRIKNKFKVAKYEQIKSAQHRELMLYIAKMSAIDATPNFAPSAIQQDEEALEILVKLYSHCFQAHEMQQKLQNTALASQIEAEIGGQYLYNFRYPLEQTLNKARNYIQSNTERLMLVKAMATLLN